MTVSSEETLLEAQATIRLLQEELAATNREVLLLTLELERRVEERTAQLKETNDELEAFSSAVSHDLRAPLRHISAFADLLEKHVGAQLDDKGRHLFQQITDSANRMSELIKGLLAFSRTSRAELHKSEVDLNGLIAATIREMETETQGREIIWDIAHLPNVSADPLLLRQVVTNVIANSIKYTRLRHPARIEIGRIASLNREVVWYVRDNGAGFDMKFADHLFGVFQRLHSESEFEGTGIGLATARRIMTRLGGRIWAEAKVDHGATFYLALPGHDRAQRS